MHFIRLFNRVGVSGRDGEYTIVRIDRPACIVDLCPSPGGTTLETDVPFSLLSAATPFNPSLADRLDSTNNTLNACWKNLRSSYTAIAELREQLRITIETIEATERRIVESDLLIARAGFAPPERSRRIQDTPIASDETR